MEQNQYPNYADPRVNGIIEWLNDNAIIRHEWDEIFIDEDTGEAVSVRRIDKKTQFHPPLRAEAERRYHDLIDLIPQLELPDLSALQFDPTLQDSCLSTIPFFKAAIDRGDTDSMANLVQAYIDTNPSFCPRNLAAASELMDRLEACGEFTDELENAWEQASEDEAESEIYDDMGISLTHPARPLEWLEWFNERSDIPISELIEHITGQPNDYRGIAKIAAGAAQFDAHVIFVTGPVSSLEALGNVIAHYYLPENLNLYDQGLGLPIK